MKTLNYITIIAIIATLMISAGCSNSPKVILQEKDGGRQLVYDPDNFMPQVETTEDINILLYEAAETLKVASNNKAVVTAKEITDALNEKDIRKLERIVVDYRSRQKMK